MKKSISLLLLCAILLPILSGCGAKSTEVPDSQVEYEIRDLYNETKNNSVYEDSSFIDSYDLQEFQEICEDSAEDPKWEIHHDPNGDMHIDTVTIDFYFDNWIGTSKFTTTRVYQYTQDNDLWSLVEIKAFKLEGFTEYSKNLAKLLAGQHTMQYCRTDDALQSDYYNFSIDVCNVDINNMTATVAYEIERHKYDVNKPREDYEISGTWSGTKEVSIRATPVDDLKMYIMFDEYELMVRFTSAGEIWYCEVDD